MHQGGSQEEPAGEHRTLPRFRQDAWLYAAPCCSSEGVPSDAGGQRRAAQAKSRWDAANKAKKLTHGQVAKAIKSGKLIPWPVCAIPECCNKPEAHHADYGLPLAVTWLCDHHHKETHKLARELEREAANDPLKCRAFALSV